MPLHDNLNILFIGYTDLGLYSHKYSYRMLPKNDNDVIIHSGFI
jgi:hypothetical protein